MPSFADRELDIMAVLWERGSGTVADVQASLHDHLAHNTVLTTLRILEDKGYVGHRVEGRAHRFHPLVDRDAAARSAISRVVEKIFSGSPKLLLTHLVRDNSLTKSDIRRLRNLLDERGRPRDK